MSAHERERLAAWIDGELSPEERRDVEAHLGECEECARLLADMAAVDGLARGLPLEAPPGYFESFPARVRTRLEATTRARRGLRGRGHGPAWTWAVAAALLLGVVTPLTLARLGRDGAPEPAVRVGAAARDTPDEAAAPGPTAPVARPEPAAPAPLPEPPASAGEELKKEIRQEHDERVEPGDRAPLQAPGFATAPASTPPAVRPPEKRDALTASVARDAAPSPALFEEGVTSRESAFEAEDAVVDEARPGAAAPRPQVAVAAAEPLAEPGADAAGGGRGARAKAQRVGPEKQSRGRRESAAIGGQAEDVQALGPATRKDADSATAWRERREEWRSFVRDHPESPRLDEARVRVIETGIEAWRAGGDSADLSRAREDAEAYLARQDARQKERVRRVLESIGDR